MRVEDAWIDYNGHMNLAYYHVLFDRTLDEAFGLAGLGPDYVAEKKASFFAAEAHVLYRRELKAGDAVRVTLQLLDTDEKRFHVYMEARHASEGWTAATCEMLSLHVDLTTKRVTPFPEEIRGNLEVMRSAHARLPRPDAVGRVIAIPSAEPQRATGTRH
ncbi:MAG: thioesterase family protein [Salinarimonas sp.]